MTYGTEGTLNDRDIENLAKQLVKDINEIIKCLETIHKNSSIARIIGDTLAGIGTGEGHRSHTLWNRSHTLWKR